MQVRSYNWRGIIKGATLSPPINRNFTAVGKFIIETGKEKNWYVICLNFKTVKSCLILLFVDHLGTYCTI